MEVIGVSDRLSYDRQLMPLGPPMRPQMIYSSCGFKDVFNLRCQQQNYHQQSVINKMSLALCDGLSPGSGKNYFYWFCFSPFQTFKTWICFPRDRPQYLAKVGQCVCKEIFLKTILMAYFIYGIWSHPQVIFWKEKFINLRKALCWFDSCMKNGKYFKFLFLVLQLDGAGSEKVTETKFPNYPSVMTTVRLLVRYLSFEYSCKDVGSFLPYISNNYLFQLFKWIKI